MCSDRNYLFDLTLIVNESPLLLSKHNIIIYHARWRTFVFLSLHNQGQLKTEIL